MIGAIAESGAITMGFKRTIIVCLFVLTITGCSGAYLGENPLQFAGKLYEGSLWTTHARGIDAVPSVQLHPKDH